MNWMAIVVGSSGSGKTSLVKTLAKITNQHMVTFHMNSSVDATELLGGFEQYDINRHVKALVDSLQNFVRNTIISHLKSGQNKDSQADPQYLRTLEKSQQVQNIWYLFL
jgi:midasin (ATPase involved in ribosome maturation)